MAEVVNDVYTFIALVMLGGYALFAFVVAYTNKSRRACMCGLTLAMLVVFFSGCTTYPPAVSWDGGVARMPSGDYTCGADALAKYLEITKGIELTDDDVKALYEEARKVDSLSDDMKGTNLLGLMRVAYAQGLVSGKVRLGSSEQVRDALSGSPVLMRLPAYQSPVWWQNGFWMSEGEYMGDHLIVCIEYKKGLFKLMDNQGPCYGSDGCVWLWEEHLDEWLKDGKANAWIIK
jgi:hypothetical protein